jgi:protein phosphatase methylesterase 1
MSDLQRSFAKAHLAKLPPKPPIFDERDEEEDEVSNLPLASPVSDSSSSASSTGTIVPSPGKNLFERHKG